MLKVTFRNIWSHKRRLLSTAASILLGVAFMAGTLVLTDTLDRAFTDLFADVNQGVDAEVRGPTLFESQFSGTLRDRFDESVVDAVAEVEGVDQAAGQVAALNGAVLDKDGDRIGGNGPPTFLANFNEDGPLNPFRLIEGRGPERDDEVVLDKAAIDAGDYVVGDEVDILTPERKTYTLVGVVRFGEADSAAGSVYAQLTMAEAQRIAGAPGRIDTVYARSDSLEPEELVEAIAAAVPGDLDVVTGEQAADERSSDVSQGFAFFRQILLVFGAIALLVATFIIYNTFSILVAQRTREMALLRAIGASRRQVLSSVLVEAVLVGLVAALLGLGAGILLAIGITALLSGVGLDLPSTGAVLRPFTIVFALAVGVGVTTLAAVVPAVRATHVPPLAALRDVAIDRSGRSWVRVVFGALLLLLAVVLALPAFGTDPRDTDLASVGLGAVCFISALVVLGPVIARPLAGLIGSPLPRLKGTTGKIARQNALRSPKRTAATAAALMIGVGLVGLITVFAASARASIESEVARGFAGDYIVQPTNSFSFDGAPVELADELHAVEGVKAVASQRMAEAEVAAKGEAGSAQFVGGIIPDQYEQLADVRMSEGSLTDLGPGGVVVDRLIARDDDLSIGDPVTVTFPGGGTLDLEIQAISDDQSMLGTWAVLQSDFDSAAAERADRIVAVALESGADAAEVRPQLEALVDRYPTLDLMDRDEWVGTLAAQVNAFLNVVYVLLFLSVVIAVIGIANTLSLSIHERTRELGLLRAVGMDRRQVRSSIRWEAVIVALLGTVLGLVVGLVGSYVLVRGLRSYGLSTFQVPFGSLIFIVVLGAVLGILAALRPARRAARLDILKAIASE